MIDDAHHVEVLAQSLWLGCFGITALRDDWVKWAAANKTDADRYRQQAKTMIGVARQQGPDAPPIPGHHHGLGWLLGS